MTLDWHDSTEHFNRAWQWDDDGGEVASSNSYSETSVLTGTAYTGGRIKLSKHQPLFTWCVLEGKPLQPYGGVWQSSSARKECDPVLKGTDNNKQTAFVDTSWFIQWRCSNNIHRVSQEEGTKLRESVPYVKIYRYNRKHLYPKLNGYGDNDQRKMWFSGGSTHCTLSADSDLQFWPRLHCQITEIPLALPQYSAS
jgi:hypothetical protein